MGILEVQLANSVNELFAYLVYPPLVRSRVMRITANQSHYRLSCIFEMLVKMVLGLLLFMQVCDNWQNRFQMRFWDLEKLIGASSSFN
jgi:hypothetical protein